MESLTHQWNRALSLSLYINHIYYLPICHYPAVVKRQKGTSTQIRPKARNENVNSFKSSSHEISNPTYFFSYSLLKA